MNCRRNLLFSLACFSYFLTVECRNHSNYSQQNYDQSLREPYYGQYYNRDNEYGSYYDRQNAYIGNTPFNNRKDNAVDSSQSNNLQGNRKDPHQGNNLQNNLQVRPLNREQNVAPLSTDDNFDRYDEYGQKIGVHSTVPNTQQRINTQIQPNQNQPNQRPNLDDRVTFKDVASDRVIIGQMPPPGGPTTQTQNTAQRNKFEPVKPQQEIEPSKISVVMTNFGLNLIKNIDKTGNAAISPFSISTTLALLQQAARGDTQYQISMALGMLPEESAATYKQIINTVKNRASRNVLKIATSIFTNAISFNLNPLFGSVAAQSFSCDVIPTTFDRPSLSATIINKWVSDRTEKLIKDIVTADIITPSSQLVLANAIFFKGLWKTYFDPQQTMPLEFHLSKGGTKTIPFMRLISNFRGGYDKKLDSQVITLPFEGAQYSLMLILPSQEANLNTVIRNLDELSLLRYLQFPTKEVKLMLPRFTVSSDTNLREVLQKMGITRLFDQQSDLSGVEVSGHLSPKISSAIHKAVISVDEKGSTAAAATAFIAVALSSDDDTIYFKADRPFMGILWDNQLNIPLFMARIEDPTA